MILSAIAKLLKKNKHLHMLCRNFKMLLIRKKYGLKYVSRTFFLGGKAKLCKDIRAGDFSYIGPNCCIGPKVIIGRFTMLANNVSILGDDHIFSDPTVPIIFSGRPELKETYIGDDVWVGAYSIIMSGVNIQDGAIIGAGSVVTKDVPAYTIFAGSPAKFIKYRFDDDKIDVHQKMLKTNKFEIKYCKEKTVF